VAVTQKRKVSAGAENARRRPFGINQSTDESRWCFTGSAYWNEVINFEALGRHNMIDRHDLARFRFAEDPASALALLQSGMAPTTETGMPAIARSRTIE
jgi:hypothetical protein